MTKVCGTDHTHNSLLSFFGSIHKQNSLRPCYNKNINLATSISGNTPNLCPFAKRTNMKNRNGQRLNREITQLSSKWRLQSKCVFLLSGLPITGPGYAIFVTVTAGGGGSALNDIRRREDVARCDQTIISRTSSLSPTSATEMGYMASGCWCAVTDKPEKPSCFNPSWEQTEWCDWDILQYNSLKPNSPER